MGVAFVLINKDSAVALHDQSFINQSYPDSTQKVCEQYSNCDFCVTNEACGFCEIKALKSGYCLAKYDDDLLVSAVGPCRSLELIGTSYEWDRNSCKTALTVLPIIIMVLYLLSFSIGYAPLPWVVNAEFYPLWARSTCVSITTACNWTFNLIISLTFLSLSQAITKFGTFFLYAGLTMVALIFIYIFLPETKGYSIDEVEMLFMTKEERQLALMKNEKTANKRNQNISVIQLT
ncbi:hypothetical protein KIN20_034625 [Parelaphostrongylus tenuis]|uniref:Major facilitator superfamily (MFS) profile domain-containing protein n=1 Tax=Parelaphostrongylus tenuis TaxID=148309 RepID=A0AAD5WJT3_PARTN|nr:hypothetical protein KIN20_034625 [Parelaphostrongylus tenuis]